MQFNVAGIVHTRDQAERIVERMRTGEFARDKISLVYADQDKSGEFTVEHDRQTDEGAIAGAGTGAVVGGVLGWLAGIGTLLIPGVGPLVAAGPLAALLGGAAIGAGVGGIAGALIGMGYTEEHARHFEHRIHRGDVLISVQTDSQAEADHARAILEQEGAEDIASFQAEETAQRR